MSICKIDEFIIRLSNSNITIDRCRYDPRDNTISIIKGSEELYIDLSHDQKTQDQLFDLFIDRVS